MKLDAIYREQVETPLIGYHPVSSSVKPVHVANGIFRALLGTGPQLTAFHDTLVRYKKGTEINTADELAGKYGEAIFGQFAKPKHWERLNLLREYLRSTFAADGAVFPDAKHSSYTLTHRTLITPDTNDFGTGKFIAAILTRDNGDGPSPLMRVIRELLEDETDEFTTIALPLISQAKLSQSSAIYLASENALQESPSPLLSAARLGFDAIAAHAEPHLRGSKLQILRYIAMFSCLIVYLHLINRNRETNPNASSTAKHLFIPLLADFGSSSTPRVRYASQSTYRAAFKEIENMILNGFKGYLEREYAGIDDQTAENILLNMELPRQTIQKEKEQKLARALFKSAYSAYRAKGIDVSTSLSAAMTDTFYKDRLATPDNFARGLGIRSGFVVPAANRAIDKYYTLTPDLIEVLVLSVTNPAEEGREAVTFTELSRRLRERYGILMGALPDDYDYLSDEGIQDADHDDLEQNAFAFQKVLTDIGKAREYADGVAVIRAAIGDFL